MCFLNLNLNHISPTCGAYGYRAALGENMLCRTRLIMMVALLYCSSFWEQNEIGQDFLHTIVFPNNGPRLNILGAGFTIA